MSQEPKNIVILDGNEAHDWQKMFAGKTLNDGTPLRLIQCSWMETACTYYAEQRNKKDGTPYKSEMLNMMIAPIMDSEKNVKRPATVTVRPDYLIIRNQVRGPTVESDRRNVLYGLMQAGIPSTNTLHSVLMCLERPVMYAALAEIERRLGHEQFPLIPYNYYSSHSQMLICDEFPAVVKIGHAHRGMGKMKIESYEQFRDISTVIALNNHYCTVEPFVKTTYQLRVQKIGDQYRAFRKLMTGSGWKSQFGGSSLENVPVDATLKRWVDEASKCFGGLTLCAIDALIGIDKNGNEKHYIIELNDSPIGFTSGFWESDTRVLVDVVMEDLNKLYSTH